MNKNNNRTFKIVGVAAFIAIAYISSFLFPIKVQFLTMDIKDAFITIGALYFGPFAGVIISLAVSLLEFLFSSNTGVYGFIMNFLGSAVFSAVASLIYMYKKKLANAIIGLICAVFSMTVIMLAANLIITPLFMASKGMTKQAIEEMIVPLLLPFNLFKGVLNAALVMVLYKPLTYALRKTRISGDSQSVKALNKNSIIITLLALLIIAAALAFIFIKLGGVFVISA